VLTVHELTIHVHKEFTMHRTIIAAVFLATITSFAIAQTSTANGNTGRVNSGTASTVNDTHNGTGSTDSQSTKRMGGQSAQSAKNKSAKSSNASGLSSSQGTTGSKGSATNGVSGTPDPKSTTTVPGTNR
jgi:hypothetical protein